MRTTHSTDGSRHQCWAQRVCLFGPFMEREYVVPASLGQGTAPARLRRQIPQIMDPLAGVIVMVVLSVKKHGMHPNAAAAFDIP